MCLAPTVTLNHEGHDMCQNIQDTCSLAQCEKCAACLDEASPKLTKCMERHKNNKGATAQRNCVDFGKVWCHKFWSTIFDCEGYGAGCFFKLMCHSPCVCPEWKKVRCGGKESGSPEECNAGKASMFQASLQGNTSSRNEAAHEISDQTTSLDESLSGKRTCR